MQYRKAQPDSLTVRDFAKQCSCEHAIERAVSFDVRLAAVWQVPVSWNYGLKSSAGRASSQSGISLHPGLKLAGNEEHLRATFLHEVAHMCEQILYGKMSHSQHWWEAMIRLGEKPWETRYHNLADCKRKVTMQETFVAIPETLEDLGL